MRNHDYWVYILTTKHSTTLYIGITNNIERRLYQHRHGEVDGFTKRYHLDRLVWLEHFRNVNDAMRPRKNSKVGAAAAKLRLSDKQTHGGSI
jgi:putative endonuclease